MLVNPKSTRYTLRDYYSYTLIKKPNFIYYNICKIEIVYIKKHNKGVKKNQGRPRRETWYVTDNKFLMLKIISTTDDSYLFFETPSLAQFLKWSTGEEPTKLK